MFKVRAALEKSEAEEDAKARVAVGVKALMEAAESSASWRPLLSLRHFAEPLLRQVAEKRDLQPLDLFGLSLTAVFAAFLLPSRNPTTAPP